MEVLAAEAAVVLAEVLAAPADTEARVAPEVPAVGIIAPRWAAVMAEAGDTDPLAPTAEVAAAAAP